MDTNQAREGVQPAVAPPPQGPDEDSQQQGPDEDSQQQGAPPPGDDEVSKHLRDLLNRPTTDLDTLTGEGGERERVSAIHYARTYPR